MQAESSDALHAATLEFLATEDSGVVAARLLGSARSVVSADAASIWVPRGDVFECRGAVGKTPEGLVGMSIAASNAEYPTDGETGCAVAASDVVVDGRLTAVLRVTRSLSENGDFAPSEHDALRRLTETAGAAMSNATRLSASRRLASDTARDLELITAMSREITSTLDLDRVLRSVVNLSSKALTFDRGAVALYEHGACDIRAVAGADGIDADDPGLKDLAVRAAWAAGVGQSFYLSERTDPGSDAEVMFLHIFAGDLERDNAMSALYLPLKDEEGIVGILLFESSRADFASQRERDLADILACQATVAVRNARLYHQVPLADAIGAIKARREAFFEIPRRKRITIAVAAAIVLAASTLIRWPLRVDGSNPVFRPIVQADIRPAVDGVVDRVFVREGMIVERGAPVLHIRDDERRARRDAALASVAAAERSAAIASSRGDAAEERLQRLRIDVLRRQASLLDEEIASSVVRAPVRGVVLTPRPEERIGSHADAGDLLATIGRTDSLEVELGVDERDITRVHPGDEVRMRIAAMPQHTFSGRVSSMAPLSSGDSTAVSFLVRGTVANPDGLLRPGMNAYARVLTDPASVAGRVFRDPARAIRLWWWRMWS
jgi:hypothetical protein